MSPRRVLIVHLDSLLVGVVENLLGSGGEFVVASTFLESDTALIREIEHSKPDVIILDDISSLMEPSNLIASIWDIQDMRIILLNHEVSMMSVYDKNEHPISTPDQLIEAIR